MSQRIAYFIPDLRGGGAERSTLNDVNREAAAGKQVDLVLARAHGPLLSNVDPRVTIVDLNAHSFSQSILPLSRYLRRSRPSILYSQMMDSGLAAVAARALSRHDCRIASTIRSTLSVQAKEVENYSAKGIKRRIARHFATYVHRKYIDEIRAVSKGVADDFAAFTGITRSRISVVPNQQNKEDILQKARQTVVHKWTGTGNNIVLGVGRLHPAKGFDNLIQAFALVRREIDCKLIILGEGDGRQELEQLVAELELGPHVDLPGFQQNPYPFMKEASVFVLSSRREGLPGVLSEALLIGTKVVSIDCKSGPREILDGGRLGALVPEGDIGALARAIADNMITDNKLP